MAIPDTGTAKPKADLNMRLAKAGIALLNDPSRSMASVLTEQGYSPKTASNPERNGINANRCISEAAKLDPTIDPKELLRLGRESLRDKLTDAYALKKAKLGEVARVVDVVEKWYGSHGGTYDSATEFVDRAQWLVDVVAELERRKRIHNDTQIESATTLDDLVVIEDAQPIDSATNHAQPSDSEPTT